MSNLKKTAVAVLVALGSTAVSAGTMGPVCTAGNVTVPCETVGWDLGIAALYLEPTYDAGYGYVNSTTAAGDTTWHEYDHQWDWGFKLEASYHWGFGSDINVNWYHLNNNRNDRDLGFFTATAGTVTGEFPGGTYARDSRWDAVNIEWGQHITASCHKSYRFHGGVQFARIRTEDRFFFPAVATTAITAGAENDYFNSHFDGFGPRWGINGNYQFGSGAGFAVGFDAATAILVGQSKFDDERNSATAGVTLSHGSKTAMVPELELSLNANYHWVCANHDASLELGYMWVNYFNAQHNLADRSLGGESDFGIHGPYLRAKYVAAT